MTDIKFNLTIVKRLGASDLVTFTTNRITNVQACTDFLPSPRPTVEAMQGLLGNFQTKESNYKIVPSELNKQLRNGAYDALIEGHADWIEYAEPLIGDNANYAARFGYPQYATRTAAEIPEGVPPKPVVVLTPNPGEILLRAKPYKQGNKVISYNWQVSEDGGETYSYLAAIGNSHRRKTMVEFGKTYRFRVAYATTAGEGPFSDHVEVSLTKDMVGKQKKKKAKEPVL